MTSDTGSFLPLHQEFPVQDALEMKRVLTKIYTDIAGAINFRENGQFEPIETISGQRFWIPGSQEKRFAYRKCFSIGFIASGTAFHPIAHGISPLALVVNIYGTVQIAGPTWHPLPHVGVIANDFISVAVGSVNATISVGAGHPNVLSGILILEYLKN